MRSGTRVTLSRAVSDDEQASNGNAGVAASGGVAGALISGLARG
jgi:hypothetical protein